MSRNKSIVLEFFLVSCLCLEWLWTDMQVTKIVLLLLLLLKRNDLSGTITNSCGGLCRLWWCSSLVLVIISLDTGFWLLLMVDNHTNHRQHWRWPVSPHDNMLWLKVISLAVFRCSTGTVHSKYWQRQQTSSRFNSRNCKTRSRQTVQSIPWRCHTQWWWWWCAIINVHLKAG